MNELKNGVLNVDREWKSSSNLKYTYKIIYIYNYIYLYFNHGRQTSETPTQITVH